MNPTLRPKRSHLILLVGWLAGVGCLVPPTGSDPTTDAGPTSDASSTSDAPLGDTGAAPDATSGDTGLPSDLGDATFGSGASDATTMADSADPSDAGADPTDAGADPDAAGDTGATDASATTDASPSACPTGNIDPQTDGDLRGSVPTPAGAFQCPAGSVFTPRVFQLTRDTHFTMFVGHNLTPTGIYRVRLFQGCDPSSSPIFSLASPRTPESRVLPPGTYTFVTCEGRGHFFAEAAPAPTNTNTSCATAATLPSTGVRTYDPNEVRYFKFSASTMGDDQHIIKVASTMNTGRARFVVRTSCDDPATEIFDSQNGTLNPPNSSLWTNGPKRYYLPIARTGTYYLVLSEVDPGHLLTLTYTRALF